MQVDTLHKVATNDAEKKRLHDEGRCFYCRDKGHISRMCPKKKKTNPGTRLPGQAAKVEVEDAGNSEIALTPKAVLEYLQNLGSHEFDKLCSRWNDETTEGGSGFHKD